MIENNGFGQELEKYWYIREDVMKFGSESIFTDFEDFGPYDRKSDFECKLQLFLKVLGSKYCSPEL